MKDWVLLKDAVVLKRTSDSIRRSGNWANRGRSPTSPSSRDIAVIGFDYRDISRNDLYVIFGAVKSHLQFMAARPRFAGIPQIIERLALLLAKELLYLWVVSDFTEMDRYCPPIANML